MTNGFDISAWQADINGMPLFDVSRMSRAKEEGNSFVIIKLGEGFQEDEFFTQHMTAALNAGLEVGVYYFSRAYDTQTAEKEAAFVINTLVEHGYTNWHVKVGIWYDYEEHRQLRNNINYGVVTPQTMTNCISVFVNQLWRAGYDFVGVYSGYSLLWDETYMYSQCPSVPVWCAQYDRNCDYPNVKIWQYTDRGIVAGVEVDCNVMY